MRSAQLLVAGLLTGVATTAAVLASPAEALSWFAPWIAIDSGDVRNLSRREVLARSLPAEDAQLGVFLAGAIGTGPDVFERRVRNSEWLWRNEKVQKVVPFSSPPRLEDVAAMELEEEDLNALRHCRPGACDVKLTAREIEAMRAAIAAAGTAWKEAAQELFRRQMFERVKRYAVGGFERLDPFHDHEAPIGPSEVAEALRESSPWLADGAPMVTKALTRYPEAPLPSCDSSIYWMKTTYLPKPTIQAVHVMVYRPDSPGPGEPSVIVVSRQIFATHYINGALSVSVLVNSPAAPDEWYLAYANRTHVDGLDGWLSGVRRYFVERRVRDRAREIFALQRDRIERGPTELTEKGNGE